MKKLGLFIFAMSQFSLALGVETGALPAHHSKKQCFESLSAAIACHIQTAANSSESLPEYCNKHNVAPFALLIKEQAIKDGEIHKALLAQKIEDHENLAWHAKNPNLSNGASLLVGLSIGGALGAMIGISAASLILGGL